MRPGHDALPQVSLHSLFLPILADLTWKYPAPDTNQLNQRGITTHSTRQIRYPSPYWYSQCCALPPRHYNRERILWNHQITSWIIPSKQCPLHLYWLSLPSWDIQWVCSATGGSYMEWGSMFFLPGLVCILHSSQKCKSISCHVVQVLFLDPKPNFSNRVHLKASHPKWNWKRESIFFVTVKMFHLLEYPYKWYHSHETKAYPNNTHSSQQCTNSHKGLHSC